MRRGLVSIIIPAYNHEKYVEDLLESIVNQTYSEIEVLVCDDCSSDNTYQRIQGYVEKLERKCRRIFICQNEINQGVCRTLNYLLSISNGEYIKPLASDDFLDPCAIEKYVKIFEEDSNIDAIDANVYLVDEEATYPLEREHILGEFFKQTPDFSVEGMTERLYNDNYICAPSLIYRRKVVESLGGYDEDIVFEDWDFNLRMAESGLCVKYCAACLVAYRQVSGSQAHSISEDGCLKHCRGQIQTLEKHRGYVEKHCSNEAQKAVLFRYFGIAKENRYVNLHRYVNRMAKEKKLSVLNWHLIYIRNKLASAIKNLLG